MTAKNQANREGGKFIPALCNILGTLIILFVILLCVPSTLPKLFGYQMYNIETGSMEPAIPIGSAVYVKEIYPEEVKEDDVIAFASANAVVVHRVVLNNSLEAKFITKGDANEDRDMAPVLYDDLIGIVVMHIPVLGVLMTYMTSTIVKVYLICFAACGALLNILAGVLRERQREKIMAQAVAEMKKRV